MAIIDEDPRGVPIYRKVLVGYAPRVLEERGWARCLWCKEREADGPKRLYCSDACRHAHTRSMRPPKARFLPCPHCGRACIKCVCITSEKLWKWRGRTPVWKLNGLPVHTSEGNPARGTTPAT